MRPWSCCWFYCTTSPISHLPFASPLCISPTRFKSFKVISRIYSGPDPTAPNQTLPFQIHHDRRSRLLHSSLPASNDDVACVHPYPKEPSATQGPCSLTPEIGGGKSGGSQSWASHVVPSANHTTASHVPKPSPACFFWAASLPILYSSHHPGQPTIRSLPYFCRSRRVLSACQALTAVFASTDQSTVGLFLLTMAWHHHRRKSLHV